MSLPVQSANKRSRGRVEQLVAHQAHNLEVAGSSPASAPNYASVAQLVVQLICNQQVVGSSPTASTSSISIDLRR